MSICHSIWWWNIFEVWYYNYGASGSVNKSGAEILIACSDELGAISSMRAHSLLSLWSLAKVAGKGKELIASNYSHNK